MTCVASMWEQCMSREADAFAAAEALDEEWLAQLMIRQLEETTPDWFVEIEEVDGPDDIDYY